ncbi:hypothetical protein K492DRAFT_189440 [Lichtheimia hyalospora FSU 10163]|nr:hypothetical protein K492DRAFT_189440 [Lichtheimia hyalospora FSU 10163]
MRNTALFLITLVCLALQIQVVQAEYPKPFQEIYVGYQEHVCYDASDYTANDTITFFFDEDRSSNVAHGPATKGCFTYIVPQGALTPPGHNSSTLLGVVRRNFYLWNVIGFPVRVVEPPRNETDSS